MQVDLQVLILTAIIPAHCDRPRSLFAICRIIKITEMVISQNDILDCRLWLRPCMEFRVAGVRWRSVRVVDVENCRNRICPWRLRCLDIARIWFSVYHLGTNKGGACHSVQE